MIEMSVEFDNPCNEGFRLSGDTFLYCGLTGNHEGMHHFWVKWGEDD